MAGRHRVTRLKTMPSIPTDAHVSHSRTVSGSVVDGHSAHGATSRRAANRDSSAVLRRWYGHLIVSVPDNLIRSNAEARRFAESRFRKKGNSRVGLCSRRYRERVRN